jgi:hypothetical protein
VAKSGAPQVLQKADPAGASLEHDAQCTLKLYLNREKFASSADCQANIWRQ